MEKTPKTFRQKCRSFAIFCVKIGISLGILFFLVYQAMQDEKAMNHLLQGEKIWSSLALGFFFTFLAVLATIIRWRQLMRMQQIPARFWNTLRVGYIGYLFNLAPMGIVGGDLLKAWLLTRQMKKEEKNAGSVILASVFVDRMIGLYAIFMTAGLAILGMGVLWRPELSPTLEKASWAVLIAWGIGTVAGAALLCPPEFSRELPPSRSRFEETFRQIATSVRLYRNFPGKLAVILLLSILIHVSFATSIFFLADGIYRAIEPPTFAQHLYISPTSMSMSAIPLPVGPVEMVMDNLYYEVTGSVGMGLTVTLAYRFVCLIIALLGVIFYFSARDEIQETMRKQGQ